MGWPIMGWPIMGWSITGWPIASQPVSWLKDQKIVKALIMAGTFGTPSPVTLS